MRLAADPAAYLPHQKTAQAANCWPTPHTAEGPGARAVRQAARAPRQAGHLAEVEEAMDCKWAEVEIDDQRVDLTLAHVREPRHGLGDRVRAPGPQHAGAARLEQQQATEEVDTAMRMTHKAVTHHPMRLLLQRTTTSEHLVALFRLQSESQPGNVEIAKRRCASRYRAKALSLMVAAESSRAQELTARQPSSTLLMPRSCRSSLRSGTSA